MTPIISIDSGSSYLKFYDGQQLGQFPAIAQRIREQAPPYKEEVVFGDTRYAVGETALMASNQQVAEPQIKRGFHGSEAQTIQMCHAFERLGLNGELPLLVQSLPYSDHQDDAVCQRVKARRLFEWQSATGQRRRVLFAQVVTTPQGVGALLHHRQQSPGYYNVATLVDIGSCTLDIVTVMYDRRTQDYQFNDSASASNRSVSVTTFKSQWSQRIHNIDGLQSRNLGYHELMALPINNDFSFSHLGDSVDLQPTFREMSLAFTKEVAAAVREATGDLWQALNAVIVTGGGAQLLDLHEWPDDRMHVLDVYANVLGQHAAAERALSKREVA